LYWNLEHLLERTDLPQFRALSNAQTAQIANHHIERRIILESSALELAMLHLTQCEVVGVTESIGLFVEKLSLLMKRVTRFEHHENLSWPPNREMVERILPGLRKKLAQANEMDIELYEKAKALSRDYFKKKPGYYQIEYLKLDRCNFSLPHMIRPAALKSVQGFLPIQFFHFLFDIEELQRRMGAYSAGLLDQCPDEREIVALKEVFGKDRVFPILSRQGLSANLTMARKPSRTEGRSKEPIGCHAWSRATANRFRSPWSTEDSPWKRPYGRFALRCVCSTRPDAAVWIALAERSSLPTRRPTERLRARG
jgi:hypothetical protein